MRVIVAGAGAFGGWTALHLARRGVQVELVDAWGAGHARASSGGETRVIRAVYGADRLYVEMVRRAFEQWLALDASLYVETGALWMHRGDDAYVRAAAPILAECGFALDPLPLDAAARRWPQIDFRSVQSVWFEPRAGALQAARACGVVRDAFVRAGGRFRIERVDPDGLIGRGDADAYVFACGPWMGELFPEIAIRPTRQEVLYFGTPAGSPRYAPPQMPIWLDFGERIFYGIPDLHGRGFKVADDTRGEPFDPTNGDRRVSAEVIDRARALLAERFPELADAPLLHGEVCQYENSPDGDLILDRRENVWFAGGGSGHGFKLGPAVGEMVAEAILAERELPEKFRLDRAATAKTQFESR